MLTNERRKKLSEWGKKGGTKSGSLKKREHFVMMGKLSAEARNKKKLEEAKTIITVDSD